MAIENKVKEIGGNQYKVFQFGARKGRTVLFRLFKVLGPGLSALAQADKASDALGPALMALAESANEDDFTYLCDACAEVTKLIQTASFSDGKTQEIEQDLNKVFDEHFRGKYVDMVRW